MFCSMKGIIMISYIKGRYIITETALLWRINGIGYEIIVPAFSAQIITQRVLWLYYHIYERKGRRDNAFGFASREEKNIMDYWISVSGIGPKAAVSILSVLTTSQLYYRHSIGRRSGIIKGARYRQKDSAKSYTGAER